VGRVYGTHGSVEKSIQVFLWESPKERDHSEDQGVDGRMGSVWILGRFAGGVVWIRLTEGRDRWRAVVNAVMNLQVFLRRGVC
jgi:hypothetical protein